MGESDRVCPRPGFDRVEVRLDRRESARSNRARRAGHASVRLHRLPLSGHAVTERGGASGTGYFNPFNNRWELALADLAAPGIEWSSQLPEIVTSDTRAGVVREGMGAVVGAGTGDNMTAALGLDVREGDTVISLGTKGTLYRRTSDEQYVLRSSGLEVWLFISRRRKIFQPSDPDPGARLSVATRVKATGVTNVRAPIALDALHSVWPIALADGIICINMIHISPWRRLWD
jgi:co-chaperonin GroES (HSP10)